MASGLVSPLLDQETFTVADYEAMPEDGHQYQLIHGTLIMSPSPIWYHQRLQIVIGGLMEVYLMENLLGKVAASPMDVYLGPHVLQPDILFISKEREHITSDRVVRGAPELVVEILSPSNARQDLVVKREIYQEYGVQEIWFVSPNQRAFEIQRREGIGYTAPFLLKDGDILTTPLLPGFSMNVTRVFDRA